MSRQNMSGEENGIKGLGGEWEVDVAVTTQLYPFFGSFSGHC